MQQFSLLFELQSFLIVFDPIDGRYDKNIFHDKKFYENFLNTPGKSSKIEIPETRLKGSNKSFGHVALKYSISLANIQISKNQIKSSWRMIM